MNNNIIDYYDNYKEDERITSSNSRKIEFIITTNALDKYINSNDRILELGAGTGVYSFYYASKGNEVVATDLTPSHVDIINEKLANTNEKINLSAEVVNASDLSSFPTESFNVVTCLGPMYHITDESLRRKCFEESLRVLKKGGILAIAYINKHFILHKVMLNNKEFLTKDFIDKIIDTGVVKANDKDCFWTDAFFTTSSEIENFVSKYNIEILDHLGTDGMNPLFKNHIDEMNEDEYSTWIYYLLKNCSDKSILGMSNHCLLLIKKL